MFQNTSSIITAIGTLAGVVGALITAAVMIQRNSRDSRNELINSLNAFVGRLQERITALQKDANDYEVEIKDLRSERDKLSSDLRALTLENLKNKEFIANLTQSSSDLGLSISPIGILMPPASTSIIVVGVDDKITDIVKSLFNNYGYSVIVSRSEEEALRAAESLPPSNLGAAIVDVLTAGIDSRSIIQKLRIMPGLQSLPIIIIVDFRNQSDRTAMILNTPLPHGVMLIPFPFKQAQLIEMVKDLIAKSSGESARLEHS